MKYLFYTFSILVLLATSSVSFAQEDIKDSNDHPLISRYKNSHIVQYSETDYDEYELATGPLEAGAEKPPIERLEGRITTIIYKTDTNKESVLKVYRNFEHAIKNAGIELLFSCANESCGRGFIKNLIAETHRSAQYLKFDPWNTDNHSNYRFLTGVLKKDGKTVYVSLVINTKNHGKYPVKVALDVIEIIDMELGLVSIDEDTLAKSMSEEGKAILEGIYFDSDKAVIKNESDKALEAISKYLKSSQATKVFIVGHTDNTGSYAYNLELSRKRARAVVNRLKEKYSIRKDRLMAVGIAEVSPVTSNFSEEGRAKNRRVEMVQMKSESLP